MPNRLKILGIAPYHGLYNLMIQYFQKRDEIAFTAMLGNMEEGVRIAKENALHYDIIISRANTARMISDAVPNLVIDIGIGYYDMLRAMKAAENTGTKCAFLGFPRLASVASTLCGLLRSDIAVFSITTAQEAAGILDQLKADGYKTVICDTVPYKYAKMIGLTPLLVTSGVESLEAAAENALNSYKKQRSLYQAIERYRQVLSFSSQSFLVFDSSGLCLADTVSEADRALIRERILTKLSSSMETKESSFFITVNNKLYAVSSLFVDEAEKPYVIFRIIRSEIPLARSKYGISILNKEDAERRFMESFYSNTELARSSLPNIEHISEQSQGVMITGEIGTGKDSLAQLVYAKSALSQNPLYMANCAVLNDKSWHFLMRNYNSPLFSNGNTIYVSNIDRLSHERQKQLLSAVLDTNMHVRNRLFFSCSTDRDGYLPHVAMEYTNMLGLVVLPIAPLRSQPDDMVSAAALYIDTLNQLLGKQVVGIDEDAAALLKEYDWPYNRTQFKRVLKKAVLNAEGPYISREVLAAALSQETDFARQIPSCSDSGPASELPINLNQTLNEINRDIILHTLGACGGNHSMAAKKLGIGRTTLWRYLNR